MTFQQRKLGDVLTLQRGFDLPTQSRIQGEIPIVSSSGITDTHAEYKCEGPGVITGRYGTIGEVFYIKDRYWPLNTTLFVSNFKGNYPRYIYYLLGQLDLKSLVATGAVPGVNRNHLHTLDILVATDLKIQQRIASILSTYDDLIENNLRRIQLLEEAARCRYRMLVEAANESRPLSQFAVMVKRGISPKYVDTDGIVVINQKCIRGLSVDYALSRLTDRNKKIAEERMLQRFDAVVNSTGTGTLGRVSIQLSDDVIATVDSHVTIVRPRSEVPPLFLSMAVYAQQEVISMMGEGATNQTELSAKRLSSELLIPVVGKEEMMEFHQATASQFGLIWNLQRQNDLLRQARDILLPRLMSGEIDVSSIAAPQSDWKVLETV